MLKARKGAMKSMVAENSPGRKEMSMKGKHISLGKRGESVARKYLEKIREDYS